MIVSTIQIVLLLATAWRLSSFDKSGHKYRPCVSFVATVWLGSCLGLSVAIAVKFPDTVTVLDVAGCVMAAAGCTAAWWCGGNVAKLLRALRMIDGR